MSVDVTVRRIHPDDGPLLRSLRLAALADAPSEATTTLARAEAHDDDHWAEAAVANASGGLQATFFAEVHDEATGGRAGEGERQGGGQAREAGPAEVVGLVGAYANRDGAANVVGLWSAPGYRDVGVASELLEAVEEWAVDAGAQRLRMWVVERNDYARRFYESEGFEATGAAMPYEPDPRIRQCEMVRRVR